jgi:hypothetical protein
MATTDTMALTTTTPQTADYLPPVDVKAVEQAMLIGDISQMTDEQRIAYYVAVCRSVGLNPLSKPFQALKGDDGKVTLYADKGCAEQLRKLHRVSVHVLGREFLDDLYIVTVRATTPDGREEESQGVVPIAKAKGVWEDYEYRGEKKRRFKAVLTSDGQEQMVKLSATERATAMMRCETKAKRRVTMAICGLGLPEMDDQHTSEAHPMTLTLSTPPSAIAETTKPLATHIADLYGDPISDPLRPDIFDLTAQLEAVVISHQGNLEALYAWAERQYGKPRVQFTSTDLTALLATVRERAKTKAGMPEQPPAETVDPETGELRGDEDGTPDDKAHDDATF